MYLVQEVILFFIHVWKVEPDYRLKWEWTYLVILEILYV